MAKVIICIHGRSNKPAHETLEGWWKDAIEEGLNKNLGTGLGNIEVKMAYYRDIYFDKPVKNRDNDEPYIPAKTPPQAYRRRIVDRIRGMLGDWADNPVDWLEENSMVFSKFARTVLKKVLTDLGEYYGDELKRLQTQQRLIDLIVQHKDDEVLLISHSMGTIVAYDVLRGLGRSPEHAGLKVEHFITMGSPLGLTAVKGNIIKEHNERLRTPSCVSRTWVNFSDPQDIVCIDSHLRDEYEENSRLVKVRDVMVCNEYVGKKGKPNEHKSYGYLRTPEVSDLIARFL
jgi:hypothetical protein